MSADVRVRRAARDDEEIRHVGDAAQVEQHDVLRLVVDGDLRRALGAASAVPLVEVAGMKVRLTLR